MDDQFDHGNLKLAGQAALASMQGLNLPSDRTFKLSLPDHPTQEWIDDVVLEAHFVAPVWSDYALVSIRPDIWGMAAYTSASVNDRIVLVADDSLVVGSFTRVEMLITSTSIVTDDSTFHQVGLHLLSINPETFFYAMWFRDLVQAHGLIAYPDCEIIDEIGLWQTGQGAENYIAHPDRRRPLFIFPKPTLLSNNAKYYQRFSKTIYSGFGPAVVSDALFKAYRSHLKDRKFSAIAIAPSGAVYALERDGGTFPAKFAELIEEIPLLQGVSAPLGGAHLGPSARAAWNPVARPPSLEQLRDWGEQFKTMWEHILDRFAPPLPVFPPSDEILPEDVESDAIPEAREKVFELDSDGYPRRAGDIAEWVDQKFPREIALLPRARRAIAKSNHPEPRRIAEALEALAGAKLRGYRGEPNTILDFETQLLRLRMRDGFSNAERLRGQTGEAYVVQHNGRRLLLQRHLCSNSSGFNDPRMIRIYYVYDSVSRMIVVGWLPSHLPNSQS